MATGGIVSVVRLPAPEVTELHTPEDCCVMTKMVSRIYEPDPHRVVNRARGGLQIAKACPHCRRPNDAEPSLFRNVSQSCCEATRLSAWETTPTTTAVDDDNCDMVDRTPTPCDLWIDGCERGIWTSRRPS